MEFVLQTIEHAVASGALLPAVITALTVPDIAGLVESPGARSQERYAAWIDTYFVAKFPAYVKHGIDGHGFYALRCKLLHEGLSSPADAPAAKKSQISAQKRMIAFNVGPGFFHLCTNTDSSNDSWTILRAEQFCKDMIDCGREWITSKAGDLNAEATLKRLVDLRTEVPPISSGVLLLCSEL